MKIKDIPTEARAYKLCYIQGDHAYFTSGEIEEQLRDDWNDAPYQCNASRPYFESNKVKGAYAYFWNKWHEPLVSVRSFISVKDINSKKIPWLSWCIEEDEGFNKTYGGFIYPGERLDEFVEKIQGSDSLVSGVRMLG